MQKRFQGVVRDAGRLFTVNLVPGQQVYNEPLYTKDSIEYRSWNPYKSKLAAAIKNGLNICPIKTNSSVLYLGAATGTTVSHISDIASAGVIYAVEVSPGAMRKLLIISRQRHNIIPLLADAKTPSQFETIIGSVDVIYQDISQPDQVDIFYKNMTKFDVQHGIIMVKARSIDVSCNPQKIFTDVSLQLKQHFSIIASVPLEPFSRDHQAIVIHNP